MQHCQRAVHRSIAPPQRFDRPQRHPFYLKLGTGLTSGATAVSWNEPLECEAICLRMMMVCHQRARMSGARERPQRERVRANITPHAQRKMLICMRAAQAHRVASQLALRAQHRHQACFEALRPRQRSCGTCFDDGQVVITTSKRDPRPPAEHRGSLPVMRAQRPRLIPSLRCMA